MTVIECFWISEEKGSQVKFLHDRVTVITAVHAPQNVHCSYCEKDGA